MSTPEQMQRDAQFLSWYHQATSYEDLLRLSGLSSLRSLRRRIKRVEKRQGKKLSPLSTTEHSQDEYIKNQVVITQLHEKIRILQKENLHLKKYAGSSELYKNLIYDALQHTYTKPENSSWMTQKSSQVTPTLFLSDLHWGEVVEPSQVNYCNIFNLEIARQRLQTVFHKTKIFLTETLNYSYDGIIVALGGDMLSGIQHEEIRETNHLTLLPTLLDLFDYLVSGLEDLLTYMPFIFLPCVVGNHGRIDQKIRAKNGVFDNFEWLLYQLLQRHFIHESRIQFSIPDAYDCYYQIYNTKMLLTHGNQFRGGSGIAGPSTPWALGDFKKRKRQDAIGQPYDTMIFGHFHTLAWGPGNSYIANNSLKGYDEYAFMNNYTYQPSGQALWITHPENGIILQHHILAEDVHSHSQKQWITFPRKS